MTAGTEQVEVAVIEDRAPTLAQLFLDRVAQSPDAEAFRFPGDDGWQSVTWSQVQEQVKALAAGLVALGVEPEQRVAIASGTRYEWILADLAIMGVGAATTTVYPSTASSDLVYILTDSQSGVVIAEDDAQVARLVAHRAELPDVRRVVVIAGTPDGDWVISLDDLIALGAPVVADHPDLLAELAGQIGPDSLATVIYTSGTTGRPKGVRLLHSSWTYEAATVDSLHILSTEDVQFLWLPLAHVFGKVLIALPLQIGFATAVDGRVDKIVENLSVVRPTFMGAAPRIFEKAYARVNAMVAAEGGVKAKIFGWGTRVGVKAAALRRSGGSISPLLAAQFAVADKLVLSKVRHRFGGRVRFFVSGSAALNSDIAEWFDGVGIKILEGYGLTETSAASLGNRPSSYVIGTVGTPYPGTEIKIADDGEILLRGPGVMQGYHNMPEATAETIDSDGWLHTGDIGNLDELGYLRITDRKKDLFKTSGGKYVAPSAIESTFKGVCPLASQLVVYGNNRNFVSALVTLDPDAVAAWSTSAGIGDKTYCEVVTSQAMRDVVQGYMDVLNSKLNRWETIKKFVLLDHDLSVEAGELTPSLKLRRKFVADKYADQLEALYTPTA
jgi:long-chain acyl-CoA synthetase